MLCQADIEVGNACWELYYLEHEVHLDGQMPIEKIVDGGDYASNTLFNKTRAESMSPALYL